MANKDVTYTGSVAILQAGLGLEWAPGQSQPISDDQATVLNVDGEGSLFVTTPTPTPESPAAPASAELGQTLPVEAMATEQQPSKATSATVTEGVQA